MKVQLFQTGDSWQDLGLIAFYRDLVEIENQIEEEELDEEVLPSLRLSSHVIEFELNEDSLEELQEECVELLRTRLNQVLLPPIEIKLLGTHHDWKHETNGFLNEKYQVELTTQEIEFLKQKKDAHGKKKAFLTQPLKKVEMTSMRNFIGLKSDWKRLTESYKKELSDFFDQQLQKFTKKAKPCPLCGRPSDRFYPMNQSRNVLFNQHHATPVRGYRSSVGKENMCPTCNLFNLYALLQTHWIPYFVNKNQVTHLFVPQMMHLTHLNSLMKRMNATLIELRNEPNLVSYATNVRNLSQRSLYVSLLTLYRWLEAKKEDLIVLDSSTKQSLTSWLIPRYSKGQNVIFKEFSKIVVDEDVFMLTSSIQYGKEKEQRGNVVESFLHEIRVDDPRWVEDLAEGILYRNRRQMVLSLFSGYKQLRKKPDKNNISKIAYSFFPDYLDFLNLEVDQLLSESLQANLRKLGLNLGTHCAEDLSLLTKLNMASSIPVFKQALNEAFFKLVKIAIQKQKDQQEIDKLYNIKSEELHQLLHELNEDNFLDVRDTLMLFTNLQAFWTIKMKNLKMKEEEKRD